MANTPLLRIDGVVIRTWKRAAITLALDSLADTASFSFSLHERRPPGEPDPLDFAGGEAVEVLLDERPLLRGYVFEARHHVSAQGTTIELVAFSATKDLVDCVHTQNRHFRDQTIAAIARELCKPFAVEVEVALGSEQASATELARFSVELGDNVASDLQRLAAFGGLLAFGGPRGQVMLGRVDEAVKVPTALVHPGNLLELSKARDLRDRFSHYVVAGAGLRGVDFDAEDDPQSRAPVVRDVGVTRFRPLVMRATSWAKGPRARAEQARAERARRAGQALQLNGKVQGLRHKDGHWDKGQLVHVTSKVLKVDHDLLIVRATLTREADRSTTELELAPPQAFEPAAIPLPRKRRARDSMADIEHPPEVAEFEDTGFWEENPELIPGLVEGQDPYGEGFVGDAEPPW